MKTEDFLKKLVDQQKMSPSQKFDLSTSQWDMFAHAQVQEYILSNDISKKEISFFVEASKYNENFLVWREPYLSLIAKQKITLNHILEFKLLAKILYGEPEKDTKKVTYRSVYAWLDQSPYLATMLDKGLMTPRLIKIIREQAFIVHMRIIEKCIFAPALDAHARGAMNLSQALEKLLTYKYFNSFLLQHWFTANALSQYFSSPLECNIQQLILRIVESNVSILNIIISSQWDTLPLLKDIPELTNIILFHLFSDRARCYKSILFIPNKEELFTQLKTQTAVSVNPTVLHLLRETATGNMSIETKRIYDDLRIKMFSRFLVMGRHESGNILYRLPLDIITLIAANAAHEKTSFSRDERISISHTYVSYFEAKKGLKRAALESSIGYSSK